MNKTFCFIYVILFVMCIPTVSDAQTGELNKILSSLQKSETKADSVLRQNTAEPTKRETTKADTTTHQQGTRSEGNVIFEADSSIIQLEKSKRGFKEIKGYRVQIAIGTADAIKKERNNFLALKLPYSAYLKQIVPEYALQVGDFHSRMEMEKHLIKIKEYYPKAFPVVEVIEPIKFTK